MGAWGTGNLENDAALDWLGDLEDNPRLEAVVDTLIGAADETDYLESSAGCEALVAGELVAAALGHPARGDGEDGARVEALAQHWPELAGHSPLALGALATVADAELSETYQLWHEEDGGAEWDAVVAELRGRLAAP